MRLLAEAEGMPGRRPEPPLQKTAELEAAAEDEAAVLEQAF